MFEMPIFFKTSNSIADPEREKVVPRRTLSKNRRLEQSTDKRLGALDPASKLKRGMDRKRTLLKQLSEDTISEL